MMNPITTWDARYHGELYGGPTPHFRVNPPADAYCTFDTRDRDVWQSIFVENEYHLGPLKADDTVVDIGMHIGSFSCLAYAKGSRQVFGYEVDRSAFETAALNASEFDSQAIRCTHAAVVRSDEGRRNMVRYVPGSMQCSPTEGERVHTISLDEIISSVGKVRMLKTDCEGYEWPILYTSQRLDEVAEICGEFHNGNHERVEWDKDLCNIDALAEYLSSRWGFTVTATNTTPLGNFWARRV